MFSPPKKKKKKKKRSGFPVLLLASKRGNKLSFSQTLDGGQPLSLEICSGINKEPEELRSALRFIFQKKKGE